MNLPEFKEFPKIARLNRDIIVTEKIDGTNGLIYINEENNIFAGSRTRWLDDHNDNFGFYHWVIENKEDLLQLGKGFHYGEWMGKGIQRGYRLNEKRFYLFNTLRWIDIYTLPEAARREYKDEYLDKIRKEYNNDKLEYCPECCYVVPILYQGLFSQAMIENCLMTLKEKGSIAIPNYMNPEGVVIYHKVANMGFKVTIKNDEKPKGAQ